MAFRNSLLPRTTGSDAPRRSATADSFLTLEERHVYAQLYKVADPENKGVITGSEAVPFFAKSGVPPNLLADIWQIADKENKGFLTPPTFSIAVKLIAAAQNGKQPSAALLNSTVPIPVFDGVYVEPYRPAGSATPTVFASEDKANTITFEEREKYTRMFSGYNPAGGLLDGEKARNIFMKSKLPLETLGQIWNLADIRKAGSLDQTEFVIAMHYIARSMDGTVKSLPSYLPPAIYAAASGLPAPVSPTATPAGLSPIARHLTGQSAAISPIIRHNTDISIGSSSTPLAIQLTGTNAFAPQFGGGGLRTTVGLDAPEWDVTAEDKAKYDKFFDKIDIMRSGVVQGDEAVEFFQNSHLPETELAHIWDLADLHQRGRLSRDEFAVAMHLINRRLAGDPLPQSLPLSLIPPSERTPSPFPGADLKRAGTIGSPSSKGLTRQLTGRVDTGGIAFLEQRQPTLGSAYRPTPSLLDEPDLIGINDFDVGTKITNETNEIQGLQLQSTTLSAATNDLKAKHSQYEATLTALQAQKKEVAARTAEIRLLYDTQSQAVQDLEATYAREQPVVNKAREEVTQAEHALQALRSEKEKLELNIEAGRAEAEGLRRRVRVIQEETNALREQLEKLRKDNKQQGQRLDINRKQVSAAEEERDKLAKQVQEAQTGGSVAVPGSPTVANVPKVDNPFEFGSSFAKSPSIAGSADPFQSLSRSGTPSIKSPAVEREDSNFSFSQQQSFVGTSDFARSISPAGSLAATSITSSVNPTASPAQERPSSINSTKFGDFDSTFSEFSSFPASGSPAPAPAARVNSFDSGSWNTAPTTPTVELPKSRVAPTPPPPSKHFSDSKRASIAGASSASLNSLASGGGKKPPAPAPQASQQTGLSSPADPFAVFSKTFEDAKNKKVGGSDLDSAFSEVAVSDFAGKFPEIGDFSKDDGFGFEDDFSKGSFSAPAPAASTSASVASTSASGPVSASVSTKAEEPVVSKPVEENLKAEATPETSSNSITDAETKFPDLSTIEGEFATTPAPTLPKEEAVAKPAQEATPAVETTREAFPAGETASPSGFSFTASLSTASAPAPPKSNFDDFDAVFSGTLSDVKVVSAPPSDFDTAFDPNFDVDIDFNPTFEAPVPAISRSTSSTTGPFASSSTAFTPSLSSPFAPAPTSSSSATLSKPALSGFDFSDFETATGPSAPSDPSELDSIFGTQNTSVAPQAGNRMSFGNAFGFEDSFGATSSTPASSAATVNPFGGVKPSVVSTKPTVVSASPPPTYVSNPSSPVESASAHPVPVPSAPPAAPPVAPTSIDDTDQVKQLLELGFEREKVVDALERYNYDFENAANFLADNAN